MSLSTLSDKEENITIKQEIMYPPIKKGIKKIIL